MSPDRPSWWSDNAILAWIALFKILLHFATNGNYGYFRDEFYYIACSDHLAWGYVDHPPLSIAILSLVRATLGDSIFAIRLPVVLAGSATVFVSGILARELGGGRFAQFLAALASLTSPFLLGVSTFYSMNAFEPLVWICGALVVARIVNTDNPKLWLLFGAIVGFGIVNKISTGIFVVGIVVGILTTQRRSDVWTPWLWLGGVTALLLFLPHLLWQISYGFPTAEFIRVASEQKIVHMPLASFLSAQIVYAGPAAAPIWIAGLLSLVATSAGKPYRMIGVGYLVMLVLVVAQQGKAYYLAPAYPMLLAAGGVAVERLTRRRQLRALRPMVVAAVLAGGFLTAPMAVPLLTPDTLARYAKWIGVEAPKEERNQPAALPQHFADRFGWQNMVETVARVYRSLTPEEQQRSTIYTRNYGEAGAIDFFGKKLGLPRATSGHNNYWLWGPGDQIGDIVIAIGPTYTELSEVFDELTHAETIVSRYAMAYETDLPIYICRRPKRPLREIWPQTKRFM